MSFVYAIPYAIHFLTNKFLLIKNRKQGMIENGKKLLLELFTKLWNFLVSSLLFPSYYFDYEFLIMCLP